MNAARTERLLNLLTLLLNTRRPIPLRAIREMEEFRAYRTADPKSGARAFERDKASLMELGVPVTWVPPEIESGLEGEGHGGYLIDRECYYLPALDLEPGDVARLSIAGAAAVANDHFPFKEAIMRALAKLGFDVSGTANAATLVHSPLRAGLNAERTGRNLQVLHEAVAQRARVQVIYHGATGARSEREVDPYGLYYRQGVWYLVGFCHLRQGERTFHLGRMEKVAPTIGSQPPDFDLPPGFELSRHTRLRPWELPNEPPCEVTVRLAARLVPAIHEIFGSRARVEERADETLVHLTVTFRRALISTVLPHGAAAEVLSPPELRAEILAIYETLAQRYGAEVA